MNIVPGMVSHEKGVDDFLDSIPLLLIFLGTALKHCPSELSHSNFTAQYAQPRILNNGTCILDVT